MGGGGELFWNDQSSAIYIRVQPYIYMVTWNKDSRNYKYQKLESRVGTAGGIALSLLGVHSLSSLTPVHTQ